MYTSRVIINRFGNSRYWRNDGCGKGRGGGAAVPPTEEPFPPVSSNPVLDLFYSVPFDEHHPVRCLSSFQIQLLLGMNTVTMPAAIRQENDTEKSQFIDVREILICGSCRRDKMQFSSKSSISYCSIAPEKASHGPQVRNPCPNLFSSYHELPKLFRW